MVFRQGLQVNCETCLRAAAKLQLRTTGSQNSASARITGQLVRVLQRMAGSLGW